MKNKSNKFSKESDETMYVCFELVMEDGKRYFCDGYYNKNLTKEELKRQCFESMYKNAIKVDIGKEFEKELDEREAKRISEEQRIGRTEHRRIKYDR